MRKSAILIALALLMSLAVPSAAATKQGQRCAVRNKVVTQSGTTFKCQFVSKKLQWRIVSQPKRQPKPIVSPSPTASTPPRPTAPQSLDTLDPYWTKFLVYEQLDAYAKGLAATVQPTVTFSPNVDQGMRATQNRLLTAAMNFWSPVYTPESRYGMPPLQVLFFDNDDADWAGTHAAQSRNQPQYQFNQAKPGEYCDFGNAGNFNMIVMCVPESEKFKFQSRQTGPHELTHSVQYWLIGDWKDATLDNACWLHEGSATFYGMYLGSEGLDSSLTEQRAFLRQLAQSYDQANGLSSASTMKSVLAAGDPEKTAQLIKQTSESVGTRNPFKYAHACYSLGALLTEAFVGAFGHSVLLDYYKAFGKSRDWTANFNSATGMTPNEFYARVTPYLAAVVKQDL